MNKVITMKSLGTCKKCSVLLLALFAVFSWSAVTHRTTGVPNRLPPEMSRCLGNRTESSSCRFEVTIGTVVRGDEWTGLSTNPKRAVRNTLLALTRGFGSKNVIVFVDDAQSCKTLPSEFAQVRCHGIFHCISTTIGLPTMDCVFESLLELTTTDTVGFINGDILVFDSFPIVIQEISFRFEHFFMVGRRFLTDAPPYVSPTNTSSEWNQLEEKVLSYPRETGAAIDYFVVRTRDAHQVLRTLPPFVMGNPRWDNVVLALFYANTNVAVVDSTLSAPILHQHMQGPQDEREMLSYNHKLATDLMGEDWVSGTIDHADYVMLNSSYFRESDLRIKLLRCAMREKKFGFVRNVPFDEDTWLRRLKLKKCAQARRWVWEALEIDNVL